MKELLELNRYLHDFSSAMWVCGCILVWLLWREARRGGTSPETADTLLRFACNLSYLTIPSLLVSLASGGVRAATFASHEHVGPVSGGTIAILAVKHVFFTILVVWGIRVHWRSRGLRRQVSAR